MPPSREAHYLSTVTGDFLSKTNVFRMVREFARYSNIDSGYYMEFGIMNGSTAIAAYRQLRGIVTDVYGFDTFTGHPAQQPADKVHAEYAPYFHEGNYKSEGLEFARQSIEAETLIPSENLHLTKGLFSDTLPNFDKSTLKGFPVCVMVDCDLYSSAVDVFNFLTPVLKTGTWLLVDDYWCYRGDPKLGVRRALDEWLGSNGRIGVSLYDNFNAFSRAYICHEL
jgi:hypothetical protein